MLLSYSVVYCGDQQSRTTLQLVHPRVPLTPRLSHELQYELDTATTADMEMNTPPPQSPPIRQQQRQMSPENSLHKHGKNGPKCQRTVSVNSLALS